MRILTLPLIVATIAGIVSSVALAKDDGALVPPGSPLIVFKNGADLSQNTDLFKTKNIDSIFYDGHWNYCDIRVTTPKSSQPSIAAGRQFYMVDTNTSTTLNTNNGVSNPLEVYKLVDPNPDNPSRVIGTLMCRTSEDEGEDLAGILKQTLHAEPVTGIQKYNIKFDPSADESPARIENANSTIAI